MRRILLAIDDSPDGLAAARAAVELAVATAATVDAVHVTPDGPLTRALEARPTGPDVDGRQARATESLLRYAADVAHRAGVAVETHVLRGQPAKAILAHASAWPADLIVMGRSGDRHVGQPYVGSDVRHVLEFAEAPVLVVPAPGASHAVARD